MPKGIVLSRFFQEIGVPTAGKILAEQAGVTGEKLTLTAFDTKRRAQKEGIEVGYEDIEATYLPELVTLLRKRLAEYGGTITENDRPFSWKITIPCEVKDELAYHPLHKRDRHSKAQGVVSFARAFGAIGLMQDFFKEVYLQHGNCIVTLAATRDADTYTPRLLTKIIEVPGVGGNQFVMHLTCADDEIFSKMKAMIEEAEPVDLSKTGAENGDTPPSATARDKRKVKPVKSSWIRRYAPMTALIAVLGVIGVNVPEWGGNTNPPAAGGATKAEPPDAGAIETLRRAERKTETKKCGYRRVRTLAQIGKIL